jgi:hypothetical protein
MSLILSMDEAEKRLGHCGFLPGGYPQVGLLALAPEQNTGIFDWTIVDIRTKPLERFRPILEADCKGRADIPLKVRHMEKASATPQGALIACPAAVSSGQQIYSDNNVRGR